jgi:hypothetical protein
MNQFNQTFSKQAEEMMKAAQTARVPESMQAFAEDTVVKGREACRKLTEVAKDGTKAFEQVATAAQANMVTFTEKMIETVTANTEAAFSAAEKMARSKTFPEAARVQAEFVQSQIAKAGEQTREFYELSARMTRETIEQVNEAATRAFETFKTRG